MNKRMPRSNWVKSASSSLLLAVLMFSFLWLNTPTVQCAAGTDDWPMFRYDPQHSGYSTSTAPATNQTLWNYTTGGFVVSSPTVVEGKVYLGSFDNKVYCLNAATGASIWNYTTGGDVYSSPAVVDGKVYVGSDDGKVYCLSALSGALIWNYTTGGFVDASPTVVGGKVYVSSWDSRIYCLDAATGTLIWNYTTSGAMMYTPAIADGKVYVGSNNTNLYCLNALSGVLIWNYTTGGDVASSPAVVDGEVYVGSTDNKVYCLNAATGALIWSYTTGGAVFSSPAVADGKVYVGSYSDKIYCLDAANGASIWNYTAACADSSPAVADGKVYVGSAFDTNVYCLNAATGAFVWSYTTMAFVISSPAVVDGRVYIVAGQVYCFGSLGSDDWPMFRYDPQHSGYSASTAYNANQTPWSYTTGGAVDSSPAVVDGRVYVGSDDGNIYCLSAATGAHIWSYTTGGAVKSSPAVVDGKVYVGSDDNKLHCLNATDGALIWNCTTGATMRYSSPAVANGRVYLGAGDGKIYCLNAEEGIQIWNYTANCNLHSSPAVADGKVYWGSKNNSASSFGGWVFCLNAVTGESIWNSTYDPLLYEGYTSSPAVADGRVYICSLEYTLGPMIGLISCLNTTTGTKIWDNAPYHPGGYGGSSIIYSSPAIVDGKVYLGSTYNGGGVVTCYDAATGAEIWRFLTGAAVESSPAVANGKVYVGSDDGRIYCLNALTGDFIWNEIINAGYSSPAVVDGIIYIGSSDGKVYCLNPAVGGWDFDDFFKLNDLRIIYPSDETLKPLGCSAAMVSDWTASAFIATKLENATEGLDTDSAFVNQASGKPTGVAGTGVVTFGGPIVNLVVAYAENASTQTGDKAPIRFHQESGTCYFQHSNGTSITGANLPSPAVSGNTDMFVVEVYRDHDGRYLLLCYGFGWKGTYAAGKYFDAEIYPNIGSYPYTWLIVKWEDTNDNGFVNTATDGDTYTIIATGQ